jgi:choline kinase
VTPAPAHVILLAAGMGTRLGELGGGLPKALFDAAGRSLLERSLEFAAQIGGQRIVVAGYRHELVAAHLAERGHQVSLLENTQFRAGNLLTVVTALPHVTGDFLVMNIDHVYPAAVADRVRASFAGAITAFVDFDRPLGADDMKVELSGERQVRRISKQLASWDCGYVGMTYVPAGKLARYRDAVAAVRADVGDSASAEQVLQRLADDGEPVAIGDISGIGWYELDTPEDVARALPALAALS